MIEALSMVAAMVLQAEVKEKEGLSLETTRRIEFTTDEATWLSLDVSPDGRSLLLEIAGDLYMLPIEGGEARAVLTGPPFESQPRFSPDGRYLYYSRKNGGFQHNASFPLWQIARMDLRSGDEDILTQEQGSAIRPLLSPDGKQLFEGSTLDRIWPSENKHRPLWWWTTSPAGVRD